MDEAVHFIAIKNGFDLRNIDSRLELAAAMMKQEQPFNSIIHRFGGGLYIREAHYRKNFLIIGQEHVSEHMNVLLKGSINIFEGSGELQTLVAPHMFVAKAGSKVGYTLEETVWQNIYVTNSTDVEYLESILFNIPDILKKHIEDKLNKEYILHEEDRQDFLDLVKESGWTVEDVLKVSSYRGDCIPLPEGSYSFSTGPSPIHGKGVFSTAEIKQGNIIAPMRLGGKRTPCGYLVNHSKNPNSIALKNSVDDMFLIANRDIHGMVGGDLGEEITLDYRQVMKLNNFWRGDSLCLQH